MNNYIYIIIRMPIITLIYSKKQDTFLTKIRVPLETKGSHLPFKKTFRWLKLSIIKGVRGYLFIL